MIGHSTLAAVDLGSNTFRLELARIVDDQIYPFDSLKETVRLAAGITADKRLDEAAQDRALAALRRFGERLRGMDAHQVRVVGTNTLRVAKNAGRFMERAETALGFPIEVVAGREEARLIFVGVSHSLPRSPVRRLVVDIGGGSTEFIIGQGFEPQVLESLYMGCVGYSLRFFPDGRITKGGLREAELAAAQELETIVHDYRRPHWDEAVGSSGSARGLRDILEQNGWAERGISRAGMEKLRAALLKAGSVDRLNIAGLRPDRLPVLPGGFAIMWAVLEQLDVDQMTVADGAMRQGVLYDLLGRFHHQDPRESTVAEFMRRYHVDQAQVGRVEALALTLFEQVAGDVAADRETCEALLAWAARLHEVGLTVAYSGYHKHSAYIVKNADMPGFSRMDQARLALLLLGHRGNLRKLRGMPMEAEDRAMILVLRLAALVHRGRSAAEVPPMRLQARGGGYSLRVDRAWSRQHPLTEAALENEIAEWTELGVGLELGSGNLSGGRRATAGA